MADDDYLINEKTQDRISNIVNKTPRLTMSIVPKILARNFHLINNGDSIQA